MKNRSRFYPRVHVDTSGVPAVGQAGGVLLCDTVAAAGLDTALSAALSAWRRPLAIHDPGKVVLDLALMLALGGDCLADIALLRAEPGVYGRVASDPTVSRTIEAPRRFRTVDLLESASGMEGIGCRNVAGSSCRSTARKRSRR